MLEKMCEAGQPRSLILGPNVIPEVHRNDRHVVILMHQDIETVAEGGACEREVEGRRQVATPPE